MNESLQRLIYVLGLVDWETAGMLSILTIFNTSERQKHKKLNAATQNKYHRRQQSTLQRRSVREGPSVDVSNATVSSYLPDSSSRSGITVAISSSLSNSTGTTVASSILHDRSGTTSRRSDPSSRNTVSQSPSWPGRSTYHVVSSREHKLTCELCAEMTGGGRVLL